MLRATYHPPEWDGPATLQLRAIPARTGTTLAVHLEGMPGADAREAMRRRWTDALARVA